jgi:phosphohistidine phosphatase
LSHFAPESIAWQPDILEMADTVPFATTVYLLRHAHAAWASPGLRDFDRPLDERGRKDAAIVADAMRERDYRPDVVYCSTAERCAETLRIVSQVLPPETEIVMLESLYGNDHRYYLGVLHDCRSSSVMLIGHNPMIEDTANALTATAAEGAARRLQNGFPTAGLAIISLTEPVEAGGGNGHLDVLLTPKKLRKHKED